MVLKNTDYYEDPSMQHYSETQFPSLFVPPDVNLLASYGNVFDSHGLATIQDDGTKRRVLELKNNAINLKAMDVLVNGVSLLVLITVMIKKLSTQML